MDDVTCCPACMSTNLHAGYGYAAGGLGGYVLCLSCDAVVEFYPETSGLDDEATERAMALAKDILGKPPVSTRVRTTAAQRESSCHN